MQKTRGARRARSLDPLSLDLFDQDILGSERGEEARSGPVYDETGRAYRLLLDYTVARLLLLFRG